MAFALRLQGRSAKAKHEANDPLSLLFGAKANKRAECLALALRAQGLSPKAKHESNDPLSLLHGARANKQSSQRMTP